MDRGTAEGTLLIELGGRTLEYRFARRRRRTLGITVDAAGLKVAAPLRAPWREIEAFLRDKERWILEVGKGRRGVEQRDACLIVTVPQRSRPLDVLMAWLKQQALNALRPRAAHYAAQLGLPPPRVALSNARTQWGVCTEEGVIRLSWRLVHVAPALADYVVAHEAAHLVELNHSRRYWALLGRLCPGWREARERLELAARTLPILRGER